MAARKTISTRLGLRGFLARLKRSRRANTLAMMAIALIPLSALAGSAVDMARLYVVKVRLQQACDAGALAGRKFMIPDESATTLDANAIAQAQTFFANNFRTGWMGTYDVDFTPTRTDDGQVSGVATATVPMTIMHMFKADDEVLAVNCEARYDLADTDIMFVLDTTGSMACKPEDATTCGGDPDTYTRDDGSTGYYDVEKTGSKLSALRDAVVDFDTTIRSNVDANTRFRYGFVTYSSTVNVGRLIPSQYMISGNYTYQSRHRVMLAQTRYNAKVSADGESDCAAIANTRVDNWDGGYSDVGSTSWHDRKYSSDYCEAASVTTTSPYWRYEAWPQNISAYVTGQAVTDPTRTDGSISAWQGCIEEAKTEADDTFDINDLPADLDPDLVPDNDDERWKPMWPDVTWDRDWDQQDIAFSKSQKRSYSDSYLQLRGYSPCGMPAKLPAVMTAQQVYDYVHDNDFRALGGTYHDVGMIWGVRMLSRKGIFASNNAAPAGRKLPHQVIVFMTDGVMAPNSSIYGLYGIEDFDHRVTGSGGSDYDNHTTRFLTECSVAKNKLGIEIYVVALGTDLTDDLKKCASPGNYAFKASSKAELSTAFKKIAERVAMLRISK